MKRKIIYLIVALVATLPAGAQKFFNDAITISNVSLWQQGSSLYVDMQIDMRNLDVSSSRSLVLTPLLTDGQNNVALEDIIIDGRRRQKAYLRGQAMRHEGPQGILIPYNKRGVLDYAQVIPYQPWMENASLNLVENLCGCANHEELIAQELISNNVSTEAKRLAQVVPVVAYIQPIAEVVKARSEQYEAHLDFPVNKSVILPDYMNNSKELANLRSMFDKIQNDKNLTVTEVSIEGFASPEGPLKYNEQLSKKRAEALKKYLTMNERIPGNLYQVTFGGENWNGLVKALENSSMPDKSTFINIIQNTTNDVQRKQEIMRVGGGAPYRMMLKDIYPSLRVVNCKINYNVAAFDVEEAKIVIKTNPKYLSLNEMYQVANSYPKGSPEFVDVFDIAVRMYPDDPVANLNAAAVELSQKDLDAAMKFLNQADQTTAEYINDMGVYNFLNGNIDQAIAAFNQAAQMGNASAKANLVQIDQILNMKKQ